MASLSDYRSGLFASVIHDWQQAVIADSPAKYKRYDHFPIKLECPPDQPMKLYGGRKPDNDGRKALCSFEALEPPCVIYSMGSNGGPI